MITVTQDAPDALNAERTAAAIEGARTLSKKSCKTCFGVGGYHIRRATLEYRTTTRGIKWKSSGLGPRTWEMCFCVRRRMAKLLKGIKGIKATPTEPPKEPLKESTKEEHDADMDRSLPSSAAVPG